VHREVFGQTETFTITALPPTGSSIVQVLPAAEYLEVLAGVSYSYSLITSSSAFFGTSAAQVSAKLLILGATCDEETVSLMGTPFDGLTRPTQLTQLMTRWGTTKYDTGGNFTLCINVSSFVTVLPILIYARGSTSTSLKMFCQFSQAKECTVILPGHGLSGAGDARIGLLPVTAAACATSSLSVPFNQTGSIAVDSQTTIEKHSFGYLTNSATLASFKACYCPSYQASGGVTGVVCTDIPANFVQSVGTLILVKASTLDAITGESAVVHSTIKVDLHVLCGTGGCSTDSSPRVKIVDSNLFNAKPYYDSSAGCRTALQSKRYLGPTNCDATNSADCVLTRSNEGSDSSVVFSGIQMDNSLMNDVGISRSYDICFCDSGCSNRENWFLVDTIQVEPLTTTFTQQSVAVSRLAVNILGSIAIGGSQAGAFRTSGSQSREMKILRDMDKQVDARACMQTAQSESLVGGHECHSLTNCDTPASSTKLSQIYGNDFIQIKEAGWVAVCYCNAQCKVSSNNWAVVGRMLVAGPKGDQSWTATASLQFPVSISGYGLSNLDSLKIIPSVGDCSSTSQPNYVLTSSSGSAYSVGTITSLSDGYRAILGGNGTVVEFSQNHGLSESDRIALSGVSTGNSDFDAMIDTDHLISVIDARRVWIDVQFKAGQFPTNIVLTGAIWRRSSQLDFASVEVLKAGAYIVCWVGSQSQAVAGSLVVSNPPYVAGTLEWGIVAVGQNGNISLVLNPVSSNRFASPANTVRIVFSAPGIIVPAGYSDPGWSSSTCDTLITNFYMQYTLVNLGSCSATVDTTRGLTQYIVTLGVDTGVIVPNSEYRIELPVYLVSVTSILASPEGPIQVWLMGPEDVVQKVHVKPRVSSP